ncbi:hypothetical protein HZS_3685 [Henneguya salminicola]|nr:hypothetical protein HZS_3685 [Henneguya salminicola]
MSLTSVRKIEWIPTTGRIIYMIGNSLRVISLLEASRVIYEANNVRKYIQNNAALLLMTDNDIHKKVELRIWKNKDSKEVNPLFPPLLVINNIKQFIALEDTTHLVLSVGLRTHWCLFSSFHNTKYFTRQICDLVDNENEEECPVYINLKLPSVVYSNIYYNYKAYSHVSLNSGKNWKIMILETDTSDCLNNSCTVLLKLPCQQNIVHGLPIDWIDTKFGEAHIGLKTVRTHLVTFDMGINWRIVPNSGLDVLLLNRGGLVFGVDKFTSRIYYSFDEMHSIEEEIILSAISDGLLDREFISLISTTKLKNQWIFSTISFSTIYKNICQPSDYFQWRAPRFYGHCYQGKEMIYARKKNEAMCTDNMPIHLYLNYSTCPCSAYDFNCDFNHYWKVDRCDLDPDSGIDIASLKCNTPNKGLRRDLGYVKLSEDSCEPKPIWLDSNVDQVEFCAADGNLYLFYIFLEREDFLIFTSPNGLYLLELDVHGRHYPNLNFAKLNAAQNLNFSRPLSFDFLNGYIYYYENFTISRLDSQNDFKSHFPQQLYYFDKNIISIFFDVYTNTLFYLQQNEYFYAISLINNMILLMLEGILSFDIQPDLGLISYSTSDGHVCHMELFSPTICIVMGTQAKKYVYNQIFSYHAVQFQNNSLFIYSSSINTNNLLSQPVLVINNVTYFGIVKDNLYYIQFLSLLRIRISDPKKHDLVSLFTSHEISFLVHRHLADFNFHKCESLKCNYYCNPFYKKKPKCFCPEKISLINESICVFDEKNPDYMIKYCHGFYCKNRKCLLNNVRCNNFDDCGDNSDENNCQITCKDGYHLCDKKCLSSNIICIIFILRFKVQKCLMLQIY